MGDFTTASGVGLFFFSGGLDLIFIPFFLLLQSSVEHLYAKQDTPGTTCDLSVPVKGTVEEIGRK